ncbi:MAG: 16S rRNA (cytosine(1402)-N(4))-methyltransferase RsmH, partial [Candidatus Eisenbacteria bacterium]|nr:16S rRNA (cytosine(1402)-N(4))-methyltransferase RsmH [Candidatus Eisenbacteria bacterium]
MSSSGRPLPSRRPVGPTSSVAHLPVLVSEVVAALVTDPGGSYVDATAGEAGHSRAILSALGPQGRLLCIDRDPDAVAAARAALHDQSDRVVVREGPFSAIAELMAQEGWERADGILVDLGLRSTALDDPARGFSFRQDGPLDMRFDPRRGVSAAELLARIDEAELTRILAEGTSRASPRRLARAILA